MKNKLVINTDERIFLLHYLFDMGRKDMCNLRQIEALVRDSNGVQKIDHFWNGKFVRISKKDLKSMLEANFLDAGFLKLI